MNCKSVGNFILLNDLRFRSPVGVMPQEQVVGNDISIDLRIGFPFAKAMESDDLADTISYADVYAIVSDEVLVPVKLLERLAGRIAGRLFSTWPQISSVDMRIMKINPPMGGDTGGAGVEIHLINDN